MTLCLKVKHSAVSRVEVETNSQDMNTKTPVSELYIKAPFKNNNVKFVDGLRPALMK